MSRLKPPCAPRHAAPVLFAATVAACGGGHAHGEHGHGHGGHGVHGDHVEFKSPEEWAARFDDPARDAWQKPEAVVRHLRLSSNTVVADIGAGTGYFTVRIAPEIPMGRIYAVDIEPSMVEYTRKRAAAKGQTNVEGVVAAPDDPRLPAPVDVVLMVDTYHHIEDRVAYLKKLKASLKPGGRIAIVDFKVDESIPGPPMEMRLTPEHVIGEAEDAGLRLATRSEGALPRQYILLFE